MSSTSGGQSPEQRIGDAAREAAVSALGEHYAAGRLTKDEFDERSGQAYAARTTSSLWPLFSDLPRPEQPRSAPASQRTADSRHGRPGWRFGAAFLPVLLVALVVSILVGHPVVLLVLLGFFVLRSSHHWGHRGYGGHRHHHGWR